MKHKFTLLFFLISSFYCFNVFAELKPVLIEPPDLQFGVYLKTNFGWECSDTTSSFRFQLSDEENFSNYVIDSIVNKKSISLFFNKLHTVYYWRVASIFDNKETFSDVFKFRTIKDTIIQIYPPCDTTLHTKVIKPFWNSIEGANNYVVSFYYGNDMVYKMIVNDTTSSAYLVSQPGKYCYNIVANIGSNNIISEKCCFYVDTNSTYINEENNISEEKVYPNPAFDKLNIQLSQNHSASFTLKIFDKLANIVYQNEYIQNNSDNIELDISMLFEGSYLLIIENQDRKISRIINFIKY